MRKTLTLAAALSLSAVPLFAQIPGVTVSCEEIWAEVDADGDGTVSPKEAARSLEADFAVIDENGDGAISQIEYRECLVQSTDDSGDWPTRKVND